MNEPHPLDQNYDDDDSSTASDAGASKHSASQLQNTKSQNARSPNTNSESTSSQSTGRASDTGPSRSVLRASLIALAITAFAVFLTAVAASNAPANSNTERVASIINRIATVLLLLSFLGILLSYQIPKVQKFLLLGVDRPMGPPLPSTSSPLFDSSLNPSSNRETPSAQPPVIGYSMSSPSTLRRPDDFLILVGVNVALLVGAWMLGFVAYEIGGLGYLGFFVGPAAVMIPGLLIAMIVWHRGCIRAYAIGALTALGCLLFISSYLPMFMFNGISFGRGGPSPEPIFLGIGFAFTGVVASGLLSAGYVKVLISTQSDRD